MGFGYNLFIYKIEIYLKNDIFLNLISKLQKIKKNN